MPITFGGGAAVVKTDLDNLVLLCSYHHRLVHEGGWMLTFDAGLGVQWFRPNGARHRAGPAPPERMPLAV